MTARLTQADNSDSLTPLPGEHGTFGKAVMQKPCRGHRSSAARVVFYGAAMF